MAQENWKRLLTLCSWMPRSSIYVSPITQSWASQGRVNRWPTSKLCASLQAWFSQVVQTNTRCTWHLPKTILQALLQVAQFNKWKTPRSKNQIWGDQLPKQLEIRQVESLVRRSATTTASTFRKSSTPFSHNIGPRSSTVASLIRWRLRQIGTVAANSSFLKFLTTLGSLTNFTGSRTNLWKKVSLPNGSSRLWKEAAITTNMED